MRRVEVDRRGREVRPLRRPSPIGEWIGFPPPLLGSEPLRLPILRRCDDWIVLEKPAGVPLRAERAGEAHGLLDALRKQISDGTPELTRLGMEEVHRVHGLDAIMGGPLLLALNRSATAELRNCVGSDQLQFDFCLLLSSTNHCAGDVCESTRPLPSGEKAVWKKAHTRFTCAGVDRHQSLWLASTSYPRDGQILAHAADVGLLPKSRNPEQPPVVNSKGLIGCWLHALTPRITIGQWAAGEAIQSPSDRRLQGLLGKMLWKRLYSA